MTMKLTREQAIAEFRKMWNWIADETEKREDAVEKKEYFKENNLGIVANDCFLCEYDWQAESDEEDSCYNCPINFGEVAEYDEDGYRNRPCVDAEDSPYMKWSDHLLDMEMFGKGHEALAKYAREVANLPEREEQP